MYPKSRVASIPIPFYLVAVSPVYGLHDLF